MRSLLVARSRAPRTASRATSAWCSTRRASVSSAAPASVIDTLLCVRFSNRTPSSSSSLRICSLTAGWATCSRSAARRKCSSSATATKYLRCRSSMVRQLGSGPPWSHLSGPSRVPSRDPVRCLLEHFRAQQLDDTEHDERAERDHADREERSVAEEGQRRAGDDHRNRDRRDRSVPGRRPARRLLRDRRGGLVEPATQVEPEEQRERWNEDDEAPPTQNRSGTHRGGLAATAPH